MRFGMGFGGHRGKHIGSDTDEVLYADITSAVPANFAPPQTHQISYTAYNRFGTVVTPTSVTYSSSNASAATVDSDGLVTAVAAGTATITVRIDAVVKTIALLVSSPTQTVTSVTITGPTSVQEAQQISLTATPKDASGNTVLNRTVTWAKGAGAGDVTLSADSGADPHVVTVTGVLNGTRAIQATCDGINSAAYTITVTEPPGGGGAYQTLAERMWYDFTDSSQLVGLVGTAANFANIREPVIAVIPNFASIASRTAPDRNGVMATRNVCRYHGAVALNTYPIIVTAVNTGTGGNNIRIDVSAATAGGNYRKWRVYDTTTTPTGDETYDDQNRSTIAAAINGVSAYITVNPNTNPPGITLPGWSSGAANTYSLSGGAAGVAASFQFVDNIGGRHAIHSASIPQPRYVAVRTMFSFSTNWTTASALGGEHTASQKFLFLRNPNSRQEFEIDSARSWQFSPGSPSGGGVVQFTNLAHHNVVGMNVLYGVTGWPLPDLYNGSLDKNNPDDFHMIWTPGPAPASPFGAPYGDGDNEWYELRWIVEYEVGGQLNVLRQTQALRRYTSGQVASPGPWRYHAIEATAPVTSKWLRPVTYSQGEHRNRQWDVTCTEDFAFYEVVDLDQYTPSWISELGIL